MDIEEDDENEDESINKKEIEEKDKEKTNLFNNIEKNNKEKSSLFNDNKEKTSLFFSPPTEANTKISSLFGKDLIDDKGINSKDKSKENKNNPSFISNFNDLNLEIKKKSSEKISPFDEFFKNNQGENKESEQNKNISLFSTNTDKNNNLFSGNKSNNIFGNNIFEIKNENKNNFGKLFENTNLDSNPFLKKTTTKNDNNTSIFKKEEGEIKNNQFNSGIF